MQICDETADTLDLQKKITSLQKELTNSFRKISKTHYELWIGSTRRTFSSGRAKKEETVFLDVLSQLGYKQTKDKEIYILKQVKQLKNFYKGKKHFITVKWLDDLSTLIKRNYQGCHENEASLRDLSGLIKDSKNIISEISTCNKKFSSVEMIEGLMIYREDFIFNPDNYLGTEHESAIQKYQSIHDNNKTGDFELGIKQSDELLADITIPTFIKEPVIILKISFLNNLGRINESFTHILNHNKLSLSLVSLRSEFLIRVKKNGIRDVIETSDIYRSVFTNSQYSEKFNLFLDYIQFFIASRNSALVHKDLVRELTTRAHLLIDDKKTSKDDTRINRLLDSIASFAHVFNELILLERTLNVLKRNRLNVSQIFNYHTRLQLLSELKFGVHSPEANIQRKHTCHSLIKIIEDGELCNFPSIALNSKFALVDQLFLMDDPITLFKFGNSIKEDISIFPKLNNSSEVIDIVILTCAAGVQLNRRNEVIHFLTDVLGLIDTNEHELTFMLTLLKRHISKMPAHRLKKLKMRSLIESIAEKAIVIERQELISDSKLAREIKIRLGYAYDLIPEESDIILDPILKQTAITLN